MPSLLDIPFSTVPSRNLLVKLANQAGLTQVKPDDGMGGYKDWAIDNLLWDRNASTASNLMGWGSALGAAFIPGVGWVARGALLGSRAARAAAVAGKLRGVGAAARGVGQAAGRLQKAEQLHGIGKAPAYGMAAMRRPAALPKLPQPSRWGTFAGNLGRDSANAVIGYQAGLAGGAALGSGIDAAIGKNNNLVAEPTYMDRATSLRENFGAPFTRIWGRTPANWAAGKVNKPLGEYLKKNLASPHDYNAAGHAGLSAGYFGGDFAANSLAPDKGTRAINAFAKRYGVDTNDPQTMREFRNRLEATGVVHRNYGDYYRGLRNYTDAQGSPITSFDTSGLKARGGGELAGIETRDLTDSLASSLGVATPMKRTTQDQFNRQPLEQQTAAGQSATVPQGQVGYNGFSMRHPSTGQPIPISPEMMNNIRRGPNGWVVTTRYGDIPVYPS